MEHFAKIGQWRLALGLTRKIIEGKLRDQMDFDSPNLARHSLVAC